MLWFRAEAVGSVGGGDMLKQQWFVVYNNCMIQARIDCCGVLYESCYIGGVDANMKQLDDGEVCCARLETSLAVLCCLFEAGLIIKGAD